MFYWIMHGIINLLYKIIQRLVFISLKSRFPVSFYINLSVMESEAVSRHKLVYTLKECLREYWVLESKIILKSHIVNFLLISRMSQYALNLWTIYYISINYCVVKRLNTKEISCTKKSFFFAVPDNESEHTAKFIKHIFTIFFISMNKNLCIGVVCKSVSLFNKLFS